MIKRRVFIVEDLHAESIREIEKMISDSSASKISEFDLWGKMDGKQEIKVYLRSLRHIVEDLLAEMGYRGLQYLHFEYREVDVERNFWSSKWRNLVADYCSPDMRRAYGCDCCISRRGENEYILRTTLRSVPFLESFPSVQKIRN
jgi:hypothetical protein